MEGGIMAYVKVENNIVVQKQNAPEKGFIKVSDDVVCSQIMQQDGSFINPNIVQTDVYEKKRRAKYPPIGDQADADYKNRQKARLWAGKANVALEQGDIATALKHLIEAMQPCDESDLIDSGINQVKQRNPKPE